MAAAFRTRFSVFPAVNVVLGSWEHLPPHDCFVTAGNCYGLMSAGIDAVVVSELGPRVQDWDFAPLLALWRAVDLVSPHRYDDYGGEIEADPGTVGSSDGPRKPSISSGEPER